MRSKNMLIVGAAVLAGAAVCLAVLRREPDPSAWSPEDLREALAARGVEYEGAYVGRPAPGEPWVNTGYYLKRPGDPRPWRELAANPAHTPRSMRGFLLVLVLLGVPGAEGPDEGRLQIGRLTVIGDPEELSRVANALP
jgi:hypothetical protein